jgi:ubiquinone/menaquinone biosynthesis C-methylase UbiE
MLALLSLALSVINTLLVLITASLAYVSIQKFRQSRGIDFILDAESAIDPIRHGLVGADPSLIRNIYSNNFFLEELSDEDCQAFPFMHAVYAHVSRMYFILSADRMDHGLNAYERDETINSWTRYLVLFKDHPAMRAVHRQTLRDRDRNAAFIDLAKSLLGDESTFPNPLVAHTDQFASGSWLATHHEAKYEARAAFALSLKLKPDSTILDVACGAGGWSATFAEQYPESKVVGFDRSPKELSFAKDGLPASHDQIRFLCAQASELPFKPGSFDVVFIANALQYKAIEEAVPDLYSLVRPGGRLIIRNFDEGYTLLFPCRPDLHAKIIGAAARASAAADRSIDPYVGRRLKGILTKCSGRATSDVVGTKLEWPFSQAQRDYIAGNIRYLGSMAKSYVSADEYQEWIALADGEPGRNLLDEKSAYYIVFEFCAQLTRP